MELILKHFHQVTLIFIVYVRSVLKQGKKIIIVDELAANWKIACEHRHISGNTAVRLPSQVNWKNTKWMKCYKPVPVTENRYMLHYWHSSSAFWQPGWPPLQETFLALPQRQHFKFTINTPFIFDMVNIHRLLWKITLTFFPHSCPC